MCEFRSRQLVGLAAMDMNQRDLILCQYGDNQTYSTTAMWVHHFLPREVRAGATRYKEKDLHG